MSVFLFAILMPILAQADPVKDADVYEITPVGETESYFATIKDTASDPLQLRIYDGSGQGKNVTVSRSKIKFDWVGSDLADKKLEERLNKSSRVVNGIRVPNDEIERSKQARAWASELEARLSAPDPLPGDPALQPEAIPVAPGPLALRGPHIGLVLGALVLIGIIVKLVILDSA